MTYEFTIEPLGQTIDVEEGQTLLDAALRNGVYLPHACGHGLCGTCKVEVVDGEVDHGDASSFALMDFEKEEGKTLACCAFAESDLTIEADIDEEPDAQMIPVKTVTGTISRIEDLTPTIKGVWLTVDDDGLPFQAGQYINVTVPGIEGRRPFSFANVPSQANEVELNVRRIPGGVMTGMVHEEAKVGDEWQLAGPYGMFFVRKSANLPMLFLAGGSGLSSPKSMICDLLEEGCELPITLVYGQRSREELYYHDEFLKLEEKHSNFTYVPALSDEKADSEWDGFRGFVHEAAKEHFDNDFRGHKAYMCGPPIMIDACITTLMQGRLFEKDFYQERFISAADGDKVRSPLFRKI